MIVVTTPGITSMCSASEAGSYLRRIDSCIIEVKTQGPSRTCNESKEDEQNKKSYLTESVHKVVLQKSIFAQIRRLILHNSNNKG